MFQVLRPAALLLAAFTLVTGVLYPAAVTGFAQLLFHEQANGSLVEQNGRVVGSTLIGQPFDDARYFWGRPSTTAPRPYNAAASTGSNLGPSNPALRDAIRARVALLREADPSQAHLAVPVDLITASASGLDPDISPAAALYQVHRVARERHLNESSIRTLVERHVEGRTFGVLGEPHVNVLLLNRALDAMAPQRGAESPTHL
mgnify:CR=1 FL=1